jgi:hypothetical protein
MKIHALKQVVYTTDIQKLCCVWYTYDQGYIPVTKYKNPCPHSNTWLDFVFVQVIFFICSSILYTWCASVINQSQYAETTDILFRGLAVLSPRTPQLYPVF